MMNKLKTSSGLVAAVMMSGLIFAGAALADDVHNQLDTSVDASLETIDLVKGGADGTVSYSVAAHDGDGVAGCNLSADAALTVAVQSGNPAVATVTPASLSFTSCTDVKAVTVKPVGAGQAEVTLAQTANGSSGFFNLSGAAFLAVVVEPPPADTTPPVIAAHLSPEPNAAGWNKSDVTVSWSISDPESAILLQTGCETVVYANETNGTTFVCSATSAGGIRQQSVTIMVDKTAPSVVITSPKNGAEYDQHQEVKADWSASDGRSGVASASGTVPSGQKIDTATAGEHTFSVTATDKAGNTAAVTSKYTVEEKKGQGGGLVKTTICHRGKASLTIAAPGVRAHLKHGDTLGTCDE